MYKLWAAALLPAILFLMPAAAAAAGPDLSLSPSPVSFAKTTVGEESDVVAVDVANVGDGGGSVEVTAIEGGDASDFKINGSDCGWVEAGGHCAVWVRFVPGSTGAKVTTLAARVKEGSEATVLLDGTAVAPQLSFSSDPLDFGIVRINQGRGENLQVTNSGEAGTRIGWSGTEGKDSGNFWIGYNDCFGGRWLAPGESCGLQVNFNPWQMVDYEALVTVYADNVAFSAAVRGTGGEAVLAPEINPVEFGNAEVDSGGRERTIVLRNEGNLGGTYFIAVIAGGDVASFELIDETCTGEEIAPGETCVANVRFDPVGIGRKTARLAMFGESGGGTMVFLRGEGEPASPEGSAGILPSSGAKPARKGRRAFARGATLRHGVRCKGARVCKRIKVFSARMATAD